MRKVGTMRKVYVSDDLHRALKRQAAEEDRSLKALADDALRDYLRRRDTRKGAKREQA